LLAAPNAGEGNLTGLEGARYQKPFTEHQTRPPNRRRGEAIDVSEWHV